MSDMSARLVAHIGQQVARAEAAEAEVEGLLKRAEQAEAVIARVRELHRPCLDPHLHDGNHCCLECSDYGRQGAVRMYPRMYPCDTIRALGGDSDD